MTKQDFQLLRARVTSAAVYVMDSLGPDHLDESYYDTAMQLELTALGVDYESQPMLVVQHRDRHVGVLRPDFYLFERDAEAGLCETIILDLKTKPRTDDGDDAQIRAYMRHSGFSNALLVNFAYDGRVIVKAWFEGSSL